MEKPAYMESRIWLEEPEPDNAFACRAAYCHGYDVYGEMVGRASWVEMLYLLFRGEAPSRSHAATARSSTPPRTSRTCSRRS